MRIDRHPNGTIKAIVLSKRNLLALLEKLEWDSKRTIGFPEWEFTNIVVQSESDEIHYKDRLPPGIMVNKQGEEY